MLLDTYGKHTHLDTYGPKREWMPNSKMEPKIAGHNWAAIIKGEWYEGRAANYDDMVEQVADAVVGEINLGSIMMSIYGDERQPIQRAYAWPVLPNSGVEMFDVSDLWSAVAEYLETELQPE